MEIFYDKEIKDVFSSLNSDEKGLSSEEAKKRTVKYGFNEIEEKKKKTAFSLFIGQFASFLILILFIAALVSFFLKEYLEASAIFAILIINAILGFIQEYRAEKSIEALKKLASLKAKALRDGKKEIIETRLLVPGDIIFLETGDKIPADARVIEEYSFETQEASLTGESLPVKKTSSALKSNIQIGDRKNIVFSGTIVTKGRAKAIVVTTGNKTEIGHIAALVQGVEEEDTPLQKKLAQLSKQLSIMTLAVTVIVFVAGLLKGGKLFEIFISSVALAVAAIPEGLPIVVTITSAIGVQKMVKRNALIRKLPAVEALGCITVICTDKTGTLTLNQMTVRKIYVDEKVIDVTGEGYSMDGSFSAKPDDLDLILKIGLLCNDSAIEDNPIGDPTEIALVVSAAKAGYKKLALENESPRIHELPFDSTRKMMTTVHNINGKKIAYTKGAPDQILKICNYAMHDGQIKSITEQDKKQILEQYNQFAGQALRVLGFAFKELKGNEKTEKLIENNMVFAGMQGMIDPPHGEVREAILKCKTAGIKVIMITGDYPHTAAAIGKDLGLEVKILTGDEIDKIANLKNVVQDIIIFARVSPEHKLKIVEALKSHNHIVAMTGDGVNDAPALKKADIGISMGITGTDVAKEASAMILTDDNFASIVNAVEEGRTIYGNIKKFLKFQLSTNAGAIFTVFMSVLLNLPLPITALQLLWINVIVDGPPALSLGVEKADKDIMQRPPRNPKEKVLKKDNLIYVLLVGIVMCIGTLSVFAWVYNNSLENLGEARTAAFTTFVMFQLFNVFNCRSKTESIFKIGLFSNLFLIIAVLITLLIQITIVYVPFMQGIFNTVPLGLKEWIAIVLVSSSVFVLFELYKLFHRKSMSGD